MHHCDQKQAFLTLSMRLQGLLKVALLHFMHAAFCLTGNASRTLLLLKVRHQQRQQRVLAKLAEVGGLSIPYFIQLASNLGYIITIDEPQPFRAGVNRAGDRLWVEDIIWVWRVNIQNSGTQSYRFRSGSSAAGERLTTFGDPVIEEVFAISNQLYILLLRISGE
jgi:hypothetical protein